MLHSKKSKIIAGTVGAVGLVAASNMPLINAATIKVQQGDTVWSLAKKYNVDREAIESANSITKLSDDVDMIYVGQSLNVPEKTETKAPASPAKQVAAKQLANKTDKTYTVKAGDTFWDLAIKYGVSVNDLKFVNPDVDLLSIGQKLNLPNGANAITPAPVKVATTTPKKVTETAKPVQVAAPAKQQQAPKQVASATTVKKIETPKKATTTVPAQPVNVAETAPKAPAQQQPAAQTPVEQQPATPAPTTPAQPAKPSTPAKPATPAPTTPAQPAKPSTPAKPATPAPTTPAQPAKPATPAPTAPTQPAKPTTPAKPATPAPAKPTTPSKPVTGSAVSIALQLSQMSIPYVWGGNALQGMDCAGLVQYVYQNAGIASLPKNTVSQEAYFKMTAVKATADVTATAQPGDVLFWGTKGATYHVAVYIGNGQFVAAPKPGDNVKVQTLYAGFMPSYVGKLA